MARFNLQLTTLILLFSVSYSTYGQEQEEKANQASLNSSVDAMFGTQIIRKDTLDKLIIDKDSLPFSKYTKIVGVNFSLTLKSDRFKEQDGYITIQYQPPSTLRGIDSIDYTLSGYQIGFCLGGKDLFYTNKQFDVIYSLGVEFGSYYLKRDNLGVGIEARRSKNGLIAPQLVLEARYFIGKLKIGVKMRGQYDISNTNWKHIDYTIKDFGGYSATGFAFQALVGYKLN